MSKSIKINGIEMFGRCKKTEETIKLLKNALRSHDWSWEYSDDMRYWKQGRESRDEISRLMNEVEDKNLARSIYNEYCPYDKFTIDKVTQNSDKEKFECADCGCFYWVEDRSNFDCPNCEHKKNKWDKLFPII